MSVTYRNESSFPHPDMRMALSRRSALACGAGLVSMMAGGVFSTAAAQGFPSSISVVVGFPPGGPNDLIARMVMPAVATRLGVPVVVDNRAGADGELAAANVARGPANASLLLFASAGALTISPAIKRNLPYAPLVDFSPIAKVASSPMVLVAGARSPYRSIADVLQAARQQPGRLTYASAGVGSPTHLAGELLCQMADVKMLHVPYRGAGPALADLAGGQVELYYAGVSTALPLIQSGKLRALGVTGRTELAALPGVAPLAASPALAGYEIDNWYGLLAPAKTPAPLREMLADTVDAAMRPLDLRQRMEAIGITPTLLKGESFARLIRDELDKWRVLAVEKGLKST